MTDDDSSDRELTSTTGHLFDVAAGSPVTGSVEGAPAHLRSDAGPKLPGQGRRSGICRGGWSLRAGLALGKASSDQLWQDYLALGGNHGRAELLAYLNDECGWSPPEHDIAAQAVNEICAEIGLGYLVARADEIDA